MNQLTTFRIIVVLTVNKYPILAFNQCKINDHVFRNSSIMKWAMSYKICLKATGSNWVIMDLANSI